MKDEERFRLERMVTFGVPAVADFSDAELILGIRRDGLVHLEAIGKLESLGKPGPGCERLFSTHYLLQLRQDVKWLDLAVALVRKHVRAKNLAARIMKARVEGGDHP